MTEQITLGDVDESYQAFVDKFKPKKTTDDCYTPDYIYDVIADYVTGRYGISRERFVQPFWPGGDYTREVYPDGCVVVDNPPFSILKQIVDWYTDRHVDYFLFCPALSSLGTIRNNGTLIAAGAAVEYANGARVNTSFITSMEPGIIARSDPELRRMIHQAIEAHNAQTKKQQPKYIYPDEVVTAAMLDYLSAHGETYEIKRDSAVFIRRLDSQAATGDNIFGGGLLLSEKAAAEKAAAEKAAAEKAAAEKAAAEKAAAEKAAATRWSLSDAERHIVHSIGRGDT